MDSEPLHDEQLAFQCREITALQLTGLVESVNRKFDEGRLTGAVFLLAAKAFDSVKAKDLPHELTFLHFLSDLFKTTSSYLDCRTIQNSFQPALTTCLVTGLESPSVNSSALCGLVRM
jgi:hypothetical protein